MACDVSSEYPEIGKPVWKEAGVDHKIDLRIGEATKTLRKLVIVLRIPDVRTGYVKSLLISRH